MGEFLSVERRGKIAILTMIKPESMNAIGTHADCDDIIDTLGTLGEDRSISAIILTGSGKAFSAGGNLKGMQDRTGIGVLDQPDHTRANYRNLSCPCHPPCPQPSLAEWLDHGRAAFHCLLGSGVSDWCHPRS